MAELLSWKNKRILITGAGGFIGSHLVEKMINVGASVRAFVHYNSRGDLGLLHHLPKQILSDVDVIAGDLCDPYGIKKVVEGCQIVFHLGALISIPYSYRHPYEVAETNFMGTLNVLTACQELGIEKLVHTSTSEVYGTAIRVPIDESHPLQGQSPYSASKIGADKLAESFFCTYGLPVVTIRPFNTYGPRQSARAVIPSIITQALTQPTINLGNLDARRDFTFVSDTVAGFLKVAEVQGINGNTYNLGSGSEIRIGELVEMIIQKIGKPVKIEIAAERLRPERSEVRRLLSDNSLARDALGWQPQVSFDQGLNQTISWIETHLDQYQKGRYEF